MSKILIVDDEMPIRELLEAFLANLGYETDALPDGATALTWLDVNRPDMMLVDVRMPGISGIEVLREAVARYPNLPVIMITGYADEELAREALSEGAYDFFLKPFDLGVVETRLFTKLGHGEHGK